MGSRGIPKHNSGRGVGLGVTQYRRMDNTLKIKPPLVIRDNEVEKVLSVFEEVIVQVRQAWVMLNADVMNICSGKRAIFVCTGTN